MESMSTSLVVLQLQGWPTFTLLERTRATRARTYQLSRAAIMELSALIVHTANDA